VEARGGVRPGAAEGRDRQAIEATLVDGEAALWESSVAQRERFEGEHPLVCWSPGRDGETPNAGYAPSEYQLKPWPIEAQSGAWCPRFAGDHTEGFEVERAAERSSQRAVSRESTPSVHSRGLTHRAAGAIVGVSNRPSQELARVPGDSILLTTHFSGADEAWLEWSLAADLSVRPTGCEAPIRLDGDCAEHPRPRR